MFQMLFLLMLGTGVGYFAHGFTFVHKAAGGVRLVVPLLLFVFGASIGAQTELLGRIGHFGWQAFVIALLGVAGSFFAACLFRRFFGGEGGAR